MNNNNNHSEHLQFIYNRLKEVHNENPNLDYMITFNNIIDYIRSSEKSFNDYMEYARKRNNEDVRNYENPDTRLDSQKSRNK